MFEGAHEAVKIHLLALGITLPRMLVIFLLLPIFARQLLPGLLRSSIAAALTIPVAFHMVPAVSEAFHAGTFDTPGYLGLLLKEGIIGLLLGYMLAIPFWAMEGMGFLIDNQRGASIAATVNPLTGHDTSPLGILFNQAFIVFFFASGGFSLFLDVVYGSYKAFPVLEVLPAFGAGLPAAALGMLDSLVRMALLLAAPVMIAMFLAEVGLAFISRFAPQLQVFFLAMPVKSALAMLMLAVYATTLFEYASERIREMGATVPRAHELLVR
ncbi:MAG TPA: type III secretion system export apparatus subunit SctT [Usitatibacter sp.]|nr:type III secretion system export apparatus subunit SctT [Usitatibacter sp.]